MNAANANDDDDFEEEYEEIEEQVEIENENENEEDEENDEDDDDEKEPSASPDVSQGMESKGHEEHSISGSFCPAVGSTGESKSSIASRTKDEEGIYVDDCKSLKLGSHLAAFDDIESVDGKNVPVASIERGAQNDIDTNNAKAFVDHGCVTAEPSVINDKEAAISTKDGFTEEAKIDVNVEADVKKAGEHTREDISEGLTSSTLPQTRPRSLSPVKELNAMNKRPAVVCNFFARGWCIKGSSCKFLHVKDHVSLTSLKPEGEEGIIELQPDTGLGYSTERSEAVGFPMATISTVSLGSSQAQELGKNHQSNESHEILPHQQEGSSHRISAHSSSSRSYKDSSISNSSVREFGGDNLKLNSVEADSVNRSRHFPGTYSTLSLSTPGSGDLPPFSSSRARFLVGCFGKDPLHASGSTSLLRSSSPFYGSESKNHSLKDFSMDPLPVASHRASDDWEPSKPFRPSYPYTQNLLSPLNLYDPIRDGIEQPKTADRLPKFLLRPETTITHAHQSTDAETVLPKTSQPEHGSDELSISGDHKLNLSDKDYGSRYSLLAEGEPMGTYNEERNSGSNSPKEEKPSRDVLGKDKAVRKKGIHDSLPRQQNNRITRKMELEMGRDRQKNVPNLDVRRDGEQSESKAMKHFRVALIDFVKELVRPTWLEGRLSKDAHKMVVKKAVEKVLSTVQPHQTPSTEESIQQYLSISELKMAKLVEAYVVKYGKS